MSNSTPLIMELDFGMGNIRSLQKAFEHFNQPVEIITHGDQIHKADAILIPGDGAYGAAIRELKKRNMFDEILKFYKTGKPIFAVCIGFQVLFQSSNEFGDHKGLGLLSGTISQFNAQKVLVPHIGWSKTKIIETNQFTQGLPQDCYFYYVHSFCLKETHNFTTGTCDYDEAFTAIATHKNLYATQFHPEKSQKWGLKLIENFINICKN